MNLGGSGAKSMSMPSSSVSGKSGDVVPDQFPAGLRVLVVDDDPTCLMILEKMLRNCLYQVTKCNRAEIALSHLRENRNAYDIIISDVHMPDMDGFKLLELVGLEMDLPVIMMSADDSKSVVMKGVTHGACDYLIKPVRIEALKNIWQHVVRKKKQEWKEVEPSGSIEDIERQQKPSEDADFSSSANEGSWKNAKRRKDEDDEADERDDSSTLKKPRVVWSVELHQQFVGAVNQLGIDKAVPKKILELMNVPGLTRENVASHLQKYRLYLRRLSGASHHQGGFNNSFMGPGDAAFGSVSSLNGLDFQALAASGQLPAQSLATLQAAALCRPPGKSISLPIMDQRNLFSFETPKLRYGEQQQMNNNNSNNKQVNLLHGIPTNMEPKQLANLQQSAQSFRGLNMVQMAQQQSRPQLMADIASNHLPRLPPSLAQPSLPNSMTSGVLGRNNGVVNNARGGGYNGIIHQTSPMVDFSVNQTTDLTGSSFPLVSNSGMSSTASKQVFQDEVNSDLKASRGFAPSYDIFSELNQPKSQEWDLHNFGTSSRHTNMQGSIDVPPSVMVNQGFSSAHNSAQNRNAASVGRVIFSGGEGSGHGNGSNIGQQLNSLLADNSHRVKAENLSDANTLFSEQFGQEDLMSALLKQQPEASGAVTNEFGFDGYHLDNLPV